MIISMLAKTKNKTGYEIAKMSLYVDNETNITHPIYLCRILKQNSLSKIHYIFLINVENCHPIIVLSRKEKTVPTKNIITTSKLKLAEEENKLFRRRNIQS